MGERATYTGDASQTSVPAVAPTTVFTYGATEGVNWRRVKNSVTEVSVLFIEKSKSGELRVTVAGGTHEPAVFVAYPGAHAHVPLNVAAWWGAHSVQRVPSPAKPRPHSTQALPVTSGANPIAQTIAADGRHRIPLIVVPPGQVDAHAAAPAADAPDEHAEHVSFVRDAPVMARNVPAEQG